MQDNIQAMLIALGAVCVGIVFNQFGAQSVPITIVGTLLIMGAFIIGITGFILFLRDVILSQGTS